MLQNPFWSKIVFAIGIIVANVPEGLLPTVTLCLSIAARRMAAKKALIKNLESVETLGCTTVVCTDKTGTLTQNRMSVTRLFLNECVHSEADAPREKEELEKLLKVAVLCNNARRKGDQKGSYVGDPTEAALLEYADRYVDVASVQAANPRLFEEPFTPAARTMITVNQVGEDQIAWLKGAPDVAFGLCSKILINGIVQPLAEAHRTAYLDAYRQFARHAERVLLFAYCPLEPRTGWRGEDLPRSGYVFTGLISMFDPPRPEVPRAVSAMHAAGIRVLMVTGDYEVTAEAIGRKVGIISSDKPVIITGEQLRGMNDAVLDWELEEKEIIFARTSPDLKLRIVQALQRRNEVVAVTGDGVNDAPALRQADIGIAMGIGGTDVAREAADMVLLDDNFATIEPAIKEGRTIFANLKKSIRYTVTHAVPEVTPYLGFILLGIPLPLTVLLILAIDLGTDMLPAIALGSELPEQDIMQLPPRSRGERLVSPGLMLLAYAFYGVIEASAAFYAYFTVLLSGGWQWGMPLAGKSTLHLKGISAFFAAIVVCQVANGLMAKAHRQSLLRQGLFSNRLLLIGIGIELALAALIIYFPPLNSLFGTAPLSFGEFFLAWPFALAMVIADEGRRWFIRRTGPDHTAPFCF